MSEKACGPRVPAAKARLWLAEPPAPDVRQTIERLERAEDVRHVAIMPDVHLAAGVCIGNVVATSRLIYPQAVGSDIGCGMAAIAFDGEAAVLAREQAARAVLAGLSAAVPVMRHRSREAAPVLPGSLRDCALSDSRLASAADREGRVELGTLGRGNHFLEFQADDDGRLWLMVHSGSRAMGQLISAWHLRHATKAAGGLCHLDAESAEGRAYLADVAWAVHYADAGRRLMVEAASSLIRRLFTVSALPGSLIACDHNHVRREEHFGESFWVHRKGANAAGPDEPGIIPGSMGTRSFHVVGRGCAESLRSSSHGAGRAMSRHDARRRISPRRLAAELDGVWVDERVAPRLREEAPSAYKDIDKVLRAQGELIRVVRRLRPVLCYKGV